MSKTEQTAQIPPAYQTITTIAKELQTFADIQAVLGWDQETYMPEAAIDGRAEQLALISTKFHALLSSDTLAKAFGTLGVSDEHPFGSGADAAGLDFWAQRSLRALWRAHKRAIRLTPEYVNELSLAVSHGQATWAKARSEDNFELFKPRLAHLIELKQKEAALVGYSVEAYDALLDEYEPDARAETIARVFAQLRKELVPLVQAIAKAKPVDTGFLRQTWPVAEQKAFAFAVAQALGYDTKSGRMDDTTHPFMTRLGRRDVRITSRWDENNFLTGLYSVMHETGHALYEQGDRPDLPEALLGGTSLGIHESQSRTWENQIGRGREFWQWALPLAKKHFGSQLSSVTAEQMYRAANTVAPSFVRVDADEVTYNLHIMVRFELELSIMRGSVKVDDLPQLWNQAYRDMLGITPPSNKLGVLQDIHWSMGGMGYFPTYTLGNLYSAMFMEQARRAIPGLDAGFANGNFAPLRSWLKESIHEWGRAKTPDELSRDICGRTLDCKPFMAYLTKKYSEIYSL